jgi:hypothetical protein
MTTEEQAVFSDLQARHREEYLNEQENSKLDELMQIYRSGLVRKAQAMNIAVKRGLMLPLNDLL